MSGITVVIPSIPVRALLLKSAIDSVLRQKMPAAGMSIAIDLTHEGAGPTRNRAMLGVQTEWLAFLDDDDEMFPHHLEMCYSVAQETGADVIVPWFQVIGGSDPFPAHQGLTIDSAYPHSFPITCLVRREVVGDARFDPDYAEDHRFWRALGAAGAKFHAIPDVTWRWNHHGTNTSGRPEKW